MAAVAFATFIVLDLLLSRPEWSEMHRWNRAFGDAGVVLIAFAMALGPLARLWSAARRLLPWRREFGVWGVLLSVVHTVIVLAGWVEWDLVRILGYEFRSEVDRYVLVRHGFGLANAIGVLALVYGIVLAATSNNRSQHFLGGTVWKFLQQCVYVFWVLIVIHTAYFVYFHFVHFHRAVPDPNWIQVPFAGLVAIVAGLQLTAFWSTWRSKKTRETNHRSSDNPTAALNTPV